MGKQNQIRNATLTLAFSALAIWVIARFGGLSSTEITRITYMSLLFGVIGTAIAALLALLSDVIPGLGFIRRIFGR